MKVWIENPFDNLPAEGYRPQRYWLMAEAFAHAGHAVTLWTSDFSHARKAPRVLKDSPMPFSLRLVPTPPYAKNVSLKRIRSHRAYARNFLAAARDEINGNGAPDLLICSLPPLSPVNGVLKLRAAFGFNLVFDVMDAWPQTFYRLAPKGLRPLARLALHPLNRLAQRAYREADLITGVCDAYEPMVRAAGAHDYYRAYHGIVIPAEKSPVWKRAADAAPALVYAGNLGHGYDLGPVIDAVKRLPGATLDIAGTGDRETEWRRRAGGDPRIRFHGYLGEDALGRLLDAATVGVIPLSDETHVGLPYKLGDYALHHLPVVTSLHGECARILEKHGVGKTYSSASSLTEALHALPTLQPDFEGLLATLAAQAIYPAYVARVNALLTCPRTTGSSV